MCLCEMAFSDCIQNQTFPVSASRTAVLDSCNLLRSAWGLIVTDTEAKKCHIRSEHICCVCMVGISWSCWNRCLLIQGVGKCRCLAAYMLFMLILMNCNHDKLLGEMMYQCTSTVVGKRVGGGGGRGRILHFMNWSNLTGEELINPFVNSPVDCHVETHHC